MSKIRRFTVLLVALLVVGVPARVKRELKPEELARLDQSWKNYVEYKNEYLKTQ